MAANSPDGAIVDYAPLNAAKGAVTLPVFDAQHPQGTQLQPC